MGCLGGVIFGIAINTHYQTSGMLSLVVLMIAFNRKSIKYLPNFLVTFLATFIPLLIFELNNHWFNTRHLWQYVTVDQYKIWVPMRWLTYTSEYWPNFLSFVMGGNRLLNTFVMAAIALTFIYLFITKKLKRTYLLLLISFIIQVIIIRYYRGERFFGYLQFFHPFIFIFIGMLFYLGLKLRLGKFVTPVLFVVYLILILPSSFRKT